MTTDLTQTPAGEPAATGNPGSGPAPARTTHPAAPDFPGSDSAAATPGTGPAADAAAGHDGTPARSGDSLLFATADRDVFAATNPDAFEATDSLFVADSLANPRLVDSLLCADSLAAADFARFGTALPERPDFRPATVTEVFGASTVAVAPAPVFHDEPLRPLTGNAFFQGAVLLLAAAYAILLYRHMADVRLVLSRPFRNRASVERLAEEPGSNSLTRFLKISDLIGLGFIGIAATRFAEMLPAPDDLPVLPLPTAPSVTLAFALLWVAVTTFQLLVLRTAGALTLTQRFVAQLRLLKRIYFALTVILAVPPFLLFALTPPGTGNTWLYASLAASAVTALLYFRESRRLFLAKKIPFLHWFLYLCSVEIFPFSLLWLIAAR